MRKQMGYVLIKLYLQKTSGGPDLPYGPEFINHLSGLILNPSSK